MGGGSFIGRTKSPVESSTLLWKAETAASVRKVLRNHTGVIADSLGVVGRVESAVGDPLRVVARGIDLAESAHDLLVVVHLDDTVVVLIADQRVSVPQPHGAGGQRAGPTLLVAIRIGIGKVFPHNVLVAVDLDDAGVIRISDKRVAVLRRLAKATRLPDR